MRTVIKKWGESAAVRIPAAAMQAAKLHLDQAVEVSADGRRIVIEPVERTECDLKTLLSGITPENLHDGDDFGKPVGKEAW